MEDYDYPVRDERVYLKCPHCNDFILTTVVRRPGVRSLIACCLVSLIAWCGCCLIPCYAAGCTDAIHKCPKCKKVVALWERKL